MAVVGWASSVWSRSVWSRSVWSRSVWSSVVWPSIVGSVLSFSGCSSGAPAGNARAEGPVAISESALGAIASERGVSRERALELGAEDALFARNLSETRPRLARWIERIVLARQTMAELHQQAVSSGPPTDAEVQAITDARFWELARPRLVRTTHALVAAEGDVEGARALAEKIAVATKGAKTSAQFSELARGVSAGNFTVTVESLPPVALDGRAVDPSFPPPAGPAVQQFDAVFAAAAQRLERPAQQSSVLHTPFGYHVIFLDSIIEPNQPGLDARRALLHDEIMTQRAQALSSELLERTRRELSPVQERSALTAMQGLAMQGLAATPARETRGAPP